MKGDYNPWLSYTQANMWGNCNRQWAYRYIEKKIIAPSGAMKQSSAYHRAAEKNYKQKVDSHRDLRVNELLEFYAAEFETVWDEVQYGAQENVRLHKNEAKGPLKDEGVAIVKEFTKVIAPKVQPLQVERKFDLAFKSGTRLQGVIDVMDDHKVIRDNKALSPKRVPNQRAMDLDLQLSIYALAHYLENGEKGEDGKWKGELLPGLAHDAIIKYASGPEARTFPTQRSEEMLRMTYDTIAGIAAQMKTGRYPRHTNWWGCSPEWCGYWDQCMGKGVVTTVDMAAQQRIEGLEESLVNGKEEGSKENQQASPQEVGEEEEGADEG